VLAHLGSHLLFPIGARCSLFAPRAMTWAVIWISFSHGNCFVSHGDNAGDRLLCLFIREESLDVASWRWLLLTIMGLTALARSGVRGAITSS